MAGDIEDGAGQFGMLGGQVQREQRAHGEAADEDLLTARLEIGERFLDVISPVGPFMAVHVLHGGPMAGEERPRDGEATLVKGVAHQAHLRRRAGEAMDEEHADGAALQEEGGWVQMWMSCHLCPSTSPRSAWTTVRAVAAGLWSGGSGRDSLTPLKKPQRHRG